MTRPLSVDRVERIDDDHVRIIWREGRSLWRRPSAPVDRVTYDGMRPLRPSLPEWDAIAQPLDAA